MRLRNRCLARSIIDATRVQRSYSDGERQKTVSEGNPPSGLANEGHTVLEAKLGRVKELTERAKGPSWRNYLVWSSG
jgi:hypothetical protein